MTLKHIMLTHVDMNMMMFIIIGPHYWSGLPQRSTAVFDISNTGLVTRHRKVPYHISLDDLLENRIIADELSELIIDGENFKWDLDRRTTSVALPTMLAVNNQMRAIFLQMMLGKYMRVKLSMSLTHSSFNRFTLLENWLRAGRIQCFRVPRRKLDPRVLRLDFKVSATLPLDDVRIRALDIVLATSELAHDVVVQVSFTSTETAQCRVIKNAPELWTIRLRLLLYIIKFCKLRPALLLLPVPYIWLDAEGSPMEATISPEDASNGFYYSNPTRYGTCVMNRDFKPAAEWIRKVEVSELWYLEKEDTLLDWAERLIKMLD
jgi:hypothetical protein